ncbi:hypothetical protein [Miltoncostaea marina]|uniref:hypothetical protein n=1 Tax=Miltoncostaea marina TaxID=2843215 RepID=UPI001C3CDC0C|nr:hypothetical protein [Miltoncostaea marina]
MRSGAAHLHGLARQDLWDQSEEDGEAEVYGHVAFTLGDQTMDLWRIDDPPDFLEIEKGTAWPGEGGGVIGERRVTVAKGADGRFPDHFTISGQLLEYDDPGGDDDLGLRAVDIPAARSTPAPTSGSSASTGAATSRGSSTRSSPRTDARDAEGPGDRGPL